MLTIKNSVQYSISIAGLLLMLTACSNNYDYTYQRPQTHQLPDIPEVASVNRPASRYTPPVNRSKPKVQTAKVHKYTPGKIDRSVITQKEVAAVTREKQWQERMKEKAVVDTDPYENIPDDSTKSKSSKTVMSGRSKPVLGKMKTGKPVKPVITDIESSSAVKTLLVKARADLAIGRTSSAIEKLERGLRIEPNNADLWYQLAKANYAKRNYSQTISMAKKSIRNTNRSYVAAKNWMLIKKAGLKSGDTVAVKEAINYFKINP